MGKVYSSLIVRPLKNFNIESRAHKIIDKNIKPTVAPKHKVSKEIIDVFIKENERVLKSTIKEKNIELDERLKGMVVEANKYGEVHMKKQSKIHNESRPKTVISEFGYVEPHEVKEGCVTIKQTMEFLAKHFANPSEYSVQDIAKDYKISIEDAKKIVTYFNIFRVHLPKNVDAKTSKGNTIEFPMFGRFQSIDEPKKS